jgi:hypothetical protein
MFRCRCRRDRHAERPNDESRSATISIARQGVAGFRFVAGSPSLRDKLLNCESVDAMAKKPNGRGWPLEYDRQLIELARATNSLEVLAAQIKRSPAAVLKRARRLGISINSQTSGKSKPSDRLKAARASARADKPKVKKQTRPSSLPCLHRNLAMRRSSSGIDAARTLSFAKKTHHISPPVLGRSNYTDW